MTHKIEVQVFETPSGNVRGIANCMMMFGKKDVRVCHALFLVGEPTEVSVKVPSGQLALEDVLRVSEAIKAFHDAVKGV